MARTRRSRSNAEHIQERRRRRRPLCTRRSATVALGKSRFTMLSEHAFTMMPQGNILGMYQVIVENIMKERLREEGRRYAMERSEIHDSVQNQVAELGQEFHSHRDVQHEVLQKLANWALRELKKEGRLLQVGPGRFRLARRKAPSAPSVVGDDEPDPESDEQAAENRRLEWLQKRSRYRARTRMEEQYRRRQRRLSQSSSSEVVSVTPSEQSLQLDDQPASHSAQS